MFTELRSMLSGKYFPPAFNTMCQLQNSRCLSFLHDHPKRDELLSVLIEAGEAAWTRGAHEVCTRCHPGGLRGLMLLCLACYPIFP